MDAALREEQVSALTHGVGALLALAGGAIMVALAALHGDGWQLAAAIVFSISLLLLYIASTLYHAIQQPRAKSALKVFDHCAIYLLIAGTYTPFTLVGLRGDVGRNLFIAIWSLAAAGIVFKLFFTGRFKLLSTAIYVAMGWLVLLAIKPVLARAGCVDLRLAARRRRCLHARHGVLPPAFDALLARGVAPVRRRGQRLPLHRGARAGARLGVTTHLH